MSLGKGHNESFDCLTPASHVSQGVGTEAPNHSLGPGQPLFANNRHVLSPSTLLAHASPHSASSSTLAGFASADHGITSPQPVQMRNTPTSIGPSPRDVLATNLSPISDVLHGNHTSMSPVSGNSSVEASGATPLTDTDGKIAKRKYSRNGCLECKRRRMKCDEGKPTCWQCARLNRKCTYVLNPKNKKRKPRKPKSNAESTSGIDADTHNDEQNENSQGNIRMKSENDFSIHGTVNDSLVNSGLPNLIPAGNINAMDANLLIQNLNDIVSMKLNDSLTNDELKDLEFNDLDLPDLNFPMLNAASEFSSVPISFLVDNTITFNTSLDSFKLGGLHDEYLRTFYYDCLDSITPFFQDQNNPLRDILLSFGKNEPYLLSAILAVGASIVHRKSNKVEDEKAYCGYLSHCLQLLGDQFKNESNVINKIEPIILTVILLTWDCIYTMNSQWRSHLKGITELFKKINSGNSSKVLNVAKCWFKVMETFANISTVLGGALIEETDLDAIFNPYDFQYVESLKSLNITTSLNEFNLLRGHNEEFDLVIKEVFKSLNLVRSLEKTSMNGNKGGILDKNIDYLLYSDSHSEAYMNKLCYFKIQKIIVEIDKQLEYQFIDKSGVIPADNQSHPSNSKVFDHAIDLVTLKNGETIAISWYDISHQTQVLSFLLIVLLKLLGVPKESIAVQQVVKRVMALFRFLDSEQPPVNLRTCYSNFAVLIAGLNAIDEETKFLVRKYYEVNGSRFRRLTEHNLNRLEKVWSGNEGKFNLQDQDVFTW
ncbi:unnamed protein product [Kluyveromyces dobzhanskii CBS 2104]|uniref:WGS project CCBQ000000000 data, contig 00015 n=1 Tax=Kluyveromyces dobzhanskii CBS 2104 TaxID=1427455 RepID=A0A0A8L8X3_9SACH|nr:unnamed protein product [Kluyveromyces dobzhanskii CBS 2104]